MGFDLNGENMKLIKLESSATKEELLAMLSDNERVNKGVAFDDRRGTPFMHVKESEGKIRIKCEYIGGASKDNAFIDGTRFSGKITEKNGRTEIKGVITTALIFHLILAAFFIAFIGMCIVRQGFSVVPLCLIVFDIFMYKDEFKKQGLIERYLMIAVKKLENDKRTDARR